MSPTIPASVSVRRSRVRNIDSDRLIRRRTFVIAQMRDGIDRRIDFVMRAAELHAIENQLQDRGIAFDRVTTRQP